jgi:hypothetical protein
MCAGVGVLIGGGGWRKEIRWWYMVDGFHIPIWNRSEKPLAIALSGVGEGGGENRGGNVNNVQYSLITIFLYRTNQ